MPETLNAEAAASRTPTALAAATAPEPAAINAAAIAETVAQTAHATGDGAAREPDGACESPDLLSEDEQSDDEDSDEGGASWLLAQLQRLQLHIPSSQTHLEVREQVLPSLDLAGVAEYIKSGRARNIVCLVGAGISVSAGIPDFRSPGTGLYAQLEKYNLSDPQNLFEIDFFRRNPEPFHTLSKELFPGNFKPTPAHFFMRLLHDKGMLLRCFTQNIDSLEKQAGLPSDAIVAAHGNFDSAHCLDCRTRYPTEYVRQAVFADEICRCSICQGLVKPQIVFFGESLPSRFFQRMTDLKKADLLITMGTSLVVHPFASLIDEVHDQCPRLLINREKVGIADGCSTGGFLFDKEVQNYRDAFFLGDADDGVTQLCSMLGWAQELQALVDAA